MNLVVDASASVRSQIGGPSAAAVLTALADSNHVATTALHLAETCNALRKYVRAGQLTAAEARDMIVRIQAVIHEVIPIADNAAEAFSEAVRLDHPVHDLLYLTLARRRGAALLTVDARLAALAASAGVAVVDLATPTPAE
ncbi:MAG: type II toxin-antitoxin system VapC family toxin [Bifidobacteriaceae bacterium]|jgi:predicted nucleic acid-binding protein|nr:type II toxin-antitoxin system VapC family toxin [Bifidobacteriaceae bacterium]